MLGDLSVAARFFWAVSAETRVSFKLSPLKVQFGEKLFACQNCASVIFRINSQYFCRSPVKPSVQLWFPALHYSFIYIPCLDIHLSPMSHVDCGVFVFWKKLKLGFLTWNSMFIHLCVCTRVQSAVFTAFNKQTSPCKSKVLNYSSGNPLLWIFSRPPLS